MRNKLFSIIVLLLLSAAANAGQQWPFLFDVNLAEKPDEVAQMIAQNSAGLPDLPLYELTAEPLDGPVTVWLWNDMASLLERTITAGPADYLWPHDTGSCAAHNGFTMPYLLPDDSSPECQTALINLQNALADLTACGLAAEPEWFILAYPPAEVNTANTDSAIDLIGVAGSALTQFPPLPDGILATEFVPKLRDIIRKLRHDELADPLNGAIAAYNNALIIAGSDCFLSEGKTQLKLQVNALIAEATAQRDHIEELKTSGEAAYEKEKLKLGAHSRARNDLILTSLSRADREFLAFWIGGVYWRMRGGGLIKFDGTQEARIYGLQRPFGVLGELAGAADGTDAANDIYLAIFNGWGEYMDMGTTPGENDKYYDLAGMTDRGHQQVAGAATRLNGDDYDTTDLIAGGLEMGPCYYFSYDQLLGFTWAPNMDEPYGGFIDGPTSIGEFCSGASIALGFVRTLLNGRATGQPPTCTIQCEGRICGDDQCGDVCGYCNDGFACDEPTGQCLAIPDDAMPDDDTLFSDELLTDADESLIDNDQSDPTDHDDDGSALADTVEIPDAADTLAVDEDTVTPGGNGGCGCSLL